MKQRNERKSRDEAERLRIARARWFVGDDVAPDGGEALGAATEAAGGQSRPVSFLCAPSRGGGGGGGGLTSGAVHLPAEEERRARREKKRREVQWRVEQETRRSVEAARQSADREERKRLAVAMAEKAARDDSIRLRSSVRRPPRAVALALAAAGEPAASGGGEDSTLWVGTRPHVISLGAQSRVAVGFETRAASKGAPAE